MRVAIAFILAVSVATIVSVAGAAGPAEKASTTNLTGAPTDVVATVGPKKITRGELENQVRAKLIELDNQRY